MTTERNEDRTVQIVESNMSRLENEIAKLNRRADKIGCPHLEIVIHSTDLKKDPTAIARLSEYYGRSGRPIPLEELELIPLVKINEVEIVGEGPKIEGFKFIGTLDHYTIPGKVIVNSVPGETVPEQFFDSSAICDHCNKIRRRVETFIVEKEDDGSYIQVGRNCLRDFFGHDPMSVARWLNRVMHFVTSLEEDEWSMGGREEVYYDSIKLLSLTVAMIRTFGWVAKSSCNEDQTPTTGNVIHYLTPPYTAEGHKHWREFKASIQLDEKKDLEEAEASLDWLVEQEANNSYMHNLKLLEDQSLVPSKMVGYWCSLIAAYQRAQARLEYAIQEKKKRLNEYVSKVGERTEIRVKCTGMQAINREFGVVNIHRMLDTDGRTLVWFANAAAKMEKDGEYIIRARIKKHDEYKGWKQTIIGRVFIVEAIEQEESA
ncbi:hypothetical protein LCGC14_2500030 [marine sediment metagenome]|uniref:Uncharacterized protein n=1 Tax=marine sediment metagenome TaxID=412755 RepID=A0A0F9DVX7_9ZZZZ